jgi:K(+)-stimulated pyrophosphate-energized sodium pump
VLIGTAVVGATTMIFSIIMMLTKGLQPDLLANLSILHPPFLLGLIAGGAVIYWFTGASTQAVSTGAYRAVEFIKKNIKLEGVEKASVEDSKKVVEICTQYAQKGMFNIFLTVFFSTLAFAFVEPYFFIGYLISIASSASTRPSSWPTPAAPGTTPRRSSRRAEEPRAPLHAAASSATRSAIPSRTPPRWP